MLLICNGPLINVRRIDFIKLIGLGVGSTREVPQALVLVLTVNIICNMHIYPETQQSRSIYLLFSLLQ